MCLRELCSPRSIAEPGCGSACHPRDGLSRLGWGHERSQTGLSLSMWRRHHGQAPAPFAKGRGRRPAGRGEGKGPPVGSPPLGTAKPAPLFAVFPFSSLLFGFWQRSRGSGWGARCRGRAAKRRQPPAAPVPPCQGWWLAEGLPEPGGAPSAARGSLRRARCQFPCELAPQAAPEALAAKAGEDGL